MPHSLAIIFFRLLAHVAVIYVLSCLWYRVLHQLSVDEYSVAEGPSAARSSSMHPDARWSCQKNKLATVVRANQVTHRMIDGTVCDCRALGIEPRVRGSPVNLDPCVAKQPRELGVMWAEKLRELAPRGLRQRARNGVARGVRGRGGEYGAQLGVGEGGG